MKVSIIGTGYVGLVTGACLAEKGHRVVCVDTESSKVAAITRGAAPFHEPGLDPLLARHVGKLLFATTDLRAAVLDSDLTLLAIGTPFDGQTIDLTYVRQATRQIGEALRDKQGYHVVAVKSTVVPGTTDSVVRPILEEASGKTAGIDLGVGMNPEFLSEGSAIEDFMLPDRIVLGGIDARTQDVQAELYRDFEGTPVVRTSNATAEFIKYTSNSLLATLISFSNEIANLCATVPGVDATDVMRGVHLMRELQPRGADGARVPAGINSFLFPGCGFGGSCLPKDVKALAALGLAAWPRGTLAGRGPANQSGSAGAHDRAAGAGPGAAGWQANGGAGAGVQARHRRCPRVAGVTDHRAIDGTGGKGAGVRPSGQPDGGCGAGRPAGHCDL